MDSEWAAIKLRDFVGRIDELSGLEESTNSRVRAGTASRERALDNAIRMLEPIMRRLMNAAEPGLGDYKSNPDDEWRARWVDAKNAALQAMGIHRFGEEAKARLRPDSPDLVADRFHSWVWEAARPLWESGSHSEAVAAAARSVNARLRQKLNRHDLGEAKLCRDAFTTKDPEPGRPRLRFPGDRSSDTWRSRQQGAGDFGAGCFEGIRNPIAHEHDVDLPEPVALEQLAALSVLARWIDECLVDSVT